MTEKYDLVVSPGPTGALLTSCVALEELRITALYPGHLVTVLAEILPTLPKTGNLSRVVLDVDDSFQAVDVDEVAWGGLDAVISEHAEKTSTKHPNRRLVLQFRTEEEGATGERDGWARELAGLFVLFPKVGDVEYVPKH